MMIFIFINFHQQASAIYLRGKHDIFFYEFLYEMCGDKVLPFLLYYAEFILRRNKRKLLKYEAEKLDPTRFKIAQRIQIVGYRIQRLNPPLPRAPPRTLNSVSRPIIIHYGHPVSTKKLKKSQIKADEKREVHQNAENLRSFHQRIVVVKGLLKKPITNQSRRDYHQNFHTLML